MTRIQIRRGTAAQWAAADPVLYAGEFGTETDTNKIKLGDGTTSWNSLVYLNLGPDKGQPNGYAALDENGLVPQEQLPITTSDWSTLEGKPAVVAAGATKTDARSAIDAEYTGNKGQPGGYASLDSNGLVPVAQWGLQVIDCGTASSSTTDVIDGGTA